MKHMSEHRAKHEKEAGRHHHARGGAESPVKGDNEAEVDLRDKPMDYTAKNNVSKEAEERKRGGHVRRRRRHGGEVHHSACKCEKCMGGAAKKAGGEVPKHHGAKHVGEVHGEHAKHHAGHKPRKSGGRTGADSNPFSSARHGEEPKGHKAEAGYD